MSIVDTLNTSVKLSDLLQSKFYQSWSAGSLPMEALQSYAREYGAFISLLPNGWEIQKDEETTEEEQEHIELWEKFAEAVGTKLGQAEIPAVKALLSTTNELFSSIPEALGALYAFEVQQPETASSKLKGLKDHYKTVDAKAYPYFEVHSCNHHEAEKLVERISELTPEEQARAAQACQMMAKSLLGALDGIHEKYGCKTQ